MWAALAFIGTLAEGAYLGTSETAKINVLTHPDWKHPIEFINALWTVLIMDFDFFNEGYGSTVRWLIFLPISIGTMISFVLVIIPAMISAVGGLFRSFGGLVGR